MAEVAVIDVFSVADLVTLVIAAIGAVTGVAALAIAVIQYYLSGPRIAVEVCAARLGSRGRLVGGSSWSSADSETLSAHPGLGVAVMAINRGRMPTSISSWGVDVGAGHSYQELEVLGGNPDLPARIEAGERLTFIAELSNVAAASRIAGRTPGQKHKTVYGTVTRSDGQTTRSKTGLTVPLDLPNLT